ncbi:MAG TPA: M15 family metallopeptidase [Chloroflexia bacterium]|jgi:hypothetical protein
MPNVHNAEHDEYRRARQVAQRMEHAAALDGGHANGATQSAYSPAMLGSRQLSGRGNAPVRIAMMQRMQQTHGNRAVQRFLQRSTSSPLAVQRCGGEVHAGCTACGGANEELQREAVQRQAPAEAAPAPATPAAGGTTEAAPADTTKAAECPLTDYSGSNFEGEAVKADSEFVSSLDTINTLAGNNKVKLYITSSFRTTSKVKGAIVTPAEKSNHMAGHAIDMNVKYGDKGTLCNSGCLGGTLPEGVSGFIKDVKATSGLRWGGDFDKKDPVHIDDGLNVNDPTKWEERYKAVQACA